MPFDYKQYEQKCSRMSKAELRREVEHQQDVVTTAGAGTGFAVLAIPLTMGLSAVAIGGTAPAIINARKKRTIAQKYLNLPGPEFGPNFSTQSAPLRARSGDVVREQRSPTKPQPSEQQLPVYAANGSELVRREKQTYVPTEDVAMDLPPSYDEATLKRMTTVVARNGTNPEESGFPGSSSFVSSAFDSSPVGIQGNGTYTSVGNTDEMTDNEKTDLGRGKGKASTKPVLTRDDATDLAMTKTTKGVKHGSWFSEFA